MTLFKSHSDFFIRKGLLVVVFFFLASGASAQSSNDPATVYPMVEQFISEAYERGIPTYHKIREIDSIAIQILPYPLTGLHLKDATYESITIHKERGSMRRVEKSFLHEVGHIFGLKHTTVPRKIMNSESYDLWFENETNWLKAKNEFFEQLKIKL